MNINRLEFIKVLEIVENALGDNNNPDEKSRIERQSFRFNGNFVYATNGEIAIETTLTFDAGVQCCINGESLLNFLKSLSSAEVSIEFDKKQVIVESLGVEAKFVTSPYNEYERIIDKLKKCVETTGQTKAVAILLDGLENCKKFAAKDKTQGSLCGVRIEGKKHLVLATDRNRIVKYLAMSDIECTIPVAFIDVLLKYKSEIYEIQLFEYFGLLGFFGNSVVATVTYDDKYPDINQHVPKDATGSINVVFNKPEDFKKALDRHIALLKNVNLADRDTCIKIDKDCPGLATLITTSKSVGTIKENFKIAVSDAMEFYVDPLLLKQSMGGCSGFAYYPETKLILFVDGNLKVVLQTRKQVK